jgi:hypothetical protein
MTLDKFGEVTRLLRRLHKLVLEQFLCGRSLYVLINRKKTRSPQSTYIAGIPLQAKSYKILKWPGERSLKHRRWVLRNKKENFHRVQLRIRRFSLGEFNGRDAQTPYVGLMVVAGLLNDLWTHPVRRPDKRVFLRGKCTAQLARDTKVGEFDCDMPGGVSTWFLPGREGKGAHHHRLHSRGYWQLSVGSQVRSGQICQATRSREDRWLTVALERTFDIAVQLSLRMEIFKPFEELTDDDGNILFSEDAGLHLQENTSLAPGKSKSEPGGRRAVWADQIGA